MTWTGLIESSPFAVAGAAMGAAYFLLLFASVRMHAAGAPFFRVLPLYAFRLAGALAGFWYFAQQGTAELLLALAGFILARTVTQRFIGKVTRWI